jgi:TonB family protein
MVYVFEHGRRIDNGSRSGIAIGASSFNWGYLAGFKNYGATLGVTYSLMGSQATEKGRIIDLYLDKASCGYQDCTDYIATSLRGTWQNNDATAGSGKYNIAFSRTKPEIEFYIFGAGNWQHWNTYSIETSFGEFLLKLQELEILESDEVEFYLENLEPALNLNSEDEDYYESDEVLSPSDYEEEPIEVETDDEEPAATATVDVQIDEPDDSDIDVPFAVIEEVPVFPGCENVADKRACFNEKLQEHISKNFRYPEIAQEMGIQGRVSVLFTIQKDGSIGNIRMRGPDRNLEAEAQRIISKLPRMLPGKQRGKAVRVPFSIPIMFKL